MRDDFPFSTASGSLIEASGWLADMLLPQGHQDRQDDDDEACLEQAVDNIESALRALEEAGYEKVEVGEEVVEGFAVPLFKTETLDTEAAAAFQAVSAVTQDIVAWKRGGARVAITEELVGKFKAILGEQYGSRLESERLTYEAIADAYDY